MNDFTDRDERHWPIWLAHLAFGIALIYIGLIFRVSDPDPSLNVPILLIYPLTMILPTIVLFAAGYEQNGRPRWAWSFEAGGILLGAVIPELLQIHAYWRGAAVSPLKDSLYLAAYGVGIAGAALFLTQKAGWEGNAIRLVLDSLMTGLAVYVALQIILPTLAPTWPWTAAAESALQLVALDAGLVFVVSVMAARYGRNGGYLLLMIIYCFLALLMADIMNLYINWRPGTKSWEFVVYPLYIIHSTCLAQGAYCSRRRPLCPNIEQPAVMPLAEWLLWTKVPRILVLATIAVAIFYRHQPVPSFGGLALVIFLCVVREILIAQDDRRVLRELHTAKERAHMAEEQTKSFLDRIIHDLAAPLHGLQTAIRRLHGEESWLARVNLHYQQLDHLVQQLRAYQKARFQPADPDHLGPVDIIPICFAAIDSIQDHAEQRGIDVHLDLAEEQGIAIADGTALRRILDNLLINALHVTPGGGTITLRTTHTNKMRLRLEVIDTGPGIPVDKQVHVFDPMVRLQGNGTGLGLAIALELALAMQGEIGLTSQEGCGSTFWVELPLHRHGRDLTAQRLAPQSM
jgi:signal transduction histidine kinase